MPSRNPQSRDQSIRGRTTALPAEGRPRRQRRLKPEAAAHLLDRRREEHLRDLYRRPVEELSPGDLLVMRAAFLRGE